MSTFVFYVNECNSFKDLKNELASKFRVDQGIAKEYEKDKIFVINAGREAVITLFSKKLIVQSSPEFQDLNRLLNLVSKYFQPEKTETRPQDHIDLKEVDKEYFIGLDESGAGECFGSLFIGMAVLDRNTLFGKMKYITPSDAKNFSLDEISALNSESNKVSKEKLKKKLKNVPPVEIDRTNKTILLDENYISLLEEEKDILKDSCIILDNYGIGTKLKNFFQKIQDEGTRILLVHNADTYYLPPMFASIFARKARNTEISNLKRENTLIDPDTGEIVQLTSGNASDPETDKWLYAYRKLHPSSKFPSFVREKWANVRRALVEYPVREIMPTFKCNNCNKDSLKLQIEYVKASNKTHMLCPNCRTIVSIEEFNKFLGQKQKIIVIDTSAIISRILSKDLLSSGYFIGFKVLLPTYIQTELDKKEPDKKRGGDNEIETISKHKIKGDIEFQEIYTEDIPNLKNDNKLIYVARKYGAMALTQDALQGAMSTVSVGTFVFQVVYHNS